MVVTLIAAMAHGRVIGASGGGLPWELPRDREHFRASTAGKAMLLGSRTYSEMRGWFTNQLPIVLSRRSPADVQARHVVATVEDGIALAVRLGARELVVSGGARTYAAAMPHVQRMVLTLIDADISGGIFFPEWNPEDWREVGLTTYPADAENPYAMRILTLERVSVS